MKEEITDADDYADWIRWAADGEHRKQNPSEAANAIGGSVLLQVQQMEVVASSGNDKKRITDDRRGDARWELPQTMMILVVKSRTSRPNQEILLRRQGEYFLSSVVGNLNGLV